MTQNIPDGGKQSVVGEKRDQRRGLASWVLATVALVLAILVFLPWASWLDHGRENELAAYGTTLRFWIVWSLGISVVAFGLTVAAGHKIEAYLEGWRLKFRRIRAPRWALGTAAIMLLLGIVLSELLFARNPHLVDTIAQLLQARIFNGGHLTAPTPDLYEFFAVSHVVREGGRWFSQYPLGHPALLAGGLLLGAPWLINPVLAALTVLLLFGIARRLLGDGSAYVTAVLFLVSPFALFMSASYMNHVSALFFLTLALYSAVRSVGPEVESGDAEGLLDRRTGWALLTGLSLGLAATVRPLEAAAWAPVLGGWLLYRRGLRTATVVAAACLAAVAPLLLYNTLTTGSPLTFGYSLLWGPGHGLGFHTDPWGEAFTPMRSFAQSALDLYRLNVFLFGWPFPSLLLLLVALAIGARTRSGLEREAALLLLVLFLAAPIGYFFYWHRDNFLGPRFLHASLAPALLLTAAGLTWLDRRLGRWRPGLRLAFLFSLVYGLGFYLPERAGIVAGRMPGMKLRPDREAAEQGIRRALVFVKVGWGNRLIPRLWAWGIPASETERSYRVVDGCRLENALDRADSLAATGVDSVTVRGWLAEHLAVWRDSDLPVIDEVLSDPTVRVDTTRPLSGDCLRNALRDRTGFTLYGTLAWRNDPWLREGVIYARDLGPQRNRRLISRYSDRPVFLYAPLSPAPHVKPVLQPYPTHLLDGLVESSAVAPPRFEKADRAAEKVPRVRAVTDEPGSGSDGASSLAKERL